MRNSRIRCPAVIAAVVLVAVTGCTEPNPAYQPGPQLPDECRAGTEVSETFENFERPDRLDLWFVIDNTEPAEDYQRALAEAVQPFLARIADRDYDVRVGVSTADATVGPGLAPVIGGPEGCEDNVRPVAESGDDGWIESVACNLRQGTDGDRRVRPMDKMYNSLVDDPESMEEFRRPAARMVAVVVTNVDDCSGESFADDPDTPARDLCAWQAGDLRELEPWVDELREQTTVAEGLNLAVVAAPPSDVTYEEPETVRRVCSSSLGSGYPAPRLRRASRLFGDRGLFESICVFDFFDTLDAIAEQLVFDDAVTLCASEPMAHEPLEVRGIDDDGESREIHFGGEFTFLGTTEDCPDGAIRLNRDGAEQIASVEMTYCGL